MSRVSVYGFHDAGALDEPVATVAIREPRVKRPAERHGHRASRLLEGQTVDVGA